ncbi:MAG: glycosyltransferase family 4 protein [Sulfurospirillum sp.]|nr:glycosyltransferase family 4 protein [Sulfurospirillum sp.]
MENKKNIWIINQYVTRYDDSGGSRHLDFAAEWVKNGYEVHIFASGFHYNEYKEKVLKDDENYKHEVINGVNLHWIRVFPYTSNNYKRFISMYTFYSNIKKYIFSNSLKKPDMVIGSSVHLLGVLAAYQVSKKFNVKFIMEIRDLWPETLVRLGKISKTHPIYIGFHFLEKFLYKKADYIVSTLCGAYKYINKFTDTNVKCIPNAFDLNKLDGLKSKNNSNHNFTVMYLGTIGIANSLDTLLKAALELKNTNIKFTIIGSGVSKQELEKFKISNHLENVIFENSIPKSKVLEKLSEAEVLWTGMPNSKELYEYGLSSNKIYDYMAVKKPILISTPLNSNIIKDARCGISVEAENSNQLKDAILNIYEMNKEQREELGQNGYDYLISNFTIQKLSAKWYEIFGIKNA